MPDETQEALDNRVIAAGRAVVAYLNAHNPNPEEVPPQGPQAALASFFGITPQAVSQWVAIGHLSLERARELEERIGYPAKDALDPDLVKAVCGCE